MKKLVLLLLALCCLAFMLPMVKSLIKGEPVRAVHIVFSMIFLTLAIATSRAGKKKSGGAPGPPSP